MALAKNHQQMDKLGYDFKFGGATLGLVKDVDPSGWKLKMGEKKVGEIGDIVIDRTIDGAEGTIKVVLHQVKIDTFRSVIPGASATGTGPIPLIPATQYQSMYALAKLLTIHPIGNSDATEDINFLKAAIVSYKLPKMSNGSEWREIELEFEPFPEQTALLGDPRQIIYGYIGTPPA